jgi:hypothetical protein
MESEYLLYYEQILLLNDESIHIFSAGHHGGCTVQELTGERNTVLHIAAEQGHGDLIAELCYHDSSLLSAANRALDTPLHSAASAGHADAVETIVRVARANVEEDALRGILCGKNDAGDTALHLAARHGHRAVVERLVKLAPELAAETDGAGVSALYLAVISRSVDAVRAIIVSCCDASAAGPNLQNALHAAVLQSSGSFYRQDVFALPNFTLPRSSTDVWSNWRNGTDVDM